MAFPGQPRRKKGESEEDTAARVQAWIDAGRPANQKQVVDGARKTPDLGIEYARYYRYRRPHRGSYNYTNRATNMTGVVYYSRSRDNFTAEQKQAEYIHGLSAAWRNGAQANLDCLGRGGCAWCMSLAWLEIATVEQARIEQQLARIWLTEDTDTDGIVGTPRQPLEVADLAGPDQVRDG